MTKQNKQSFLYGAAVLMASTVIVKIVGAIFKIPLTSILHETGMGYFNSAYTLYTTVYALTVTGLSAGVARMVAENSANKRYRDVRKILKLATIIFLVLGTLGFIFVMLFGKTFANISENPNSYMSVMMIAPAILFCCLMASYRGYYEGLSNMTPTAITQVVEVIIKLVVGLLAAGVVMGIANKQFVETGMVFGTIVETQDAATLAALPMAAAGAMLGVSLSTLIGFVYIFIYHKLKGDYITKDMLRESPKSRRAKVLLYRLIKISIPITLGAAVLQLSAMIDAITIMNRLNRSYELDPARLDLLYGGMLRPNEEMNVFLFGCFGVAITFFNLVPAFTNIFGKSALPNVTSAWTQRDREKVKLNIESVIRVTFLISAPASFGMAFMAKPIMQLFYKDMQGAVQVGGMLLAMLAIGSLFLSLVTPMNAIMQGIGRMDLPVKYLFAGAMVKLVMNIVLIGIPAINVMGAAISTICCYLLIAVLSINKLRQVVNVKLNFKSIIIKPIFSGLFCGISAFSCYKLLSLWKINSIITLLSICVGALVYIVSLRFLNVLSKDDILMLPKGKKIAKTLEKFKFLR